MADGELLALAVTDGEPVVTEDWLVALVADDELSNVDGRDSTLIAFRVGLGTPPGFILPWNVDDLIPLIESQPRVSQ